MEVAISAFQNIKTVERESFINKSYFYLLDQANGDYNTITYSQPDSPTAIDDGDREEKQLDILITTLPPFSLVFVSCHGTIRLKGVDLYDRAELLPNKERQLVNRPLYL